MGADLGVSHFRSFSIHSLLPDWVPGVEGQDLGFDADVAGPAAGGGADGPCDLPSERFLDKCISIPGLFHIISNLTEEVDKMLLHWKEYSEQVATIETLLAERGLREMYPVGTSRDQ